jgi:hypothetical protein
MKKLLLFVILLATLANSVNAQTPQYTVVTPNTNGNFFPFGAQATCGSSMVQLLYKPSDWTSLPPVGFITKLWFRWYSSCPATGNTYTNLNVKMGATTLNGLTSGAWNAGLTNVVTIPSMTVTSGPLQWFSIDLSANPYYYDNTQNLIIEISHNGGTTCASLFISWVNGPTNQRMWGTYGSTSSSGSDLERYDMGIDLFAGYPCTGTPTSTVNAPIEVCPNRQFKVQPATFYSNASYYWQYSDNGGATWQPHPATVGLYGDISDAITTARTYKCTITCIATGMSYTTPPWTVNISQFYMCYCVASAGTLSGLDIGNVTVTNLTSNKVVLNNGLATPYLSNTQATKGYTSFQTSLTPTPLYRDTTYRFSVSQISSAATTKPGYAAIYVDFDRNGVFDAAEKVLNKTITTASIVPYTESDVFKVPTTAKVGLTGMRVILSDTKPDSCGTITGEGEVEDYLVDLRNEPCNGKTNAGIVQAPEKSLCKDYDYIVLDTTYEKLKSETERYWQVSADSVYWTGVAGSTNQDQLSKVFNGQPVYYRVRMVCQRTNDTSYSNAQKVDAKAGYKCYCYSQATGGVKDTSDVGGMTLSTFTSNSGGAHVLNPTAYRKREDFTDNAPLTMFTDSVYQLIVYHTMRSAEHGDAKVTVFMDFNNNKEYDVPYERVYTGYTSIGAFTLIQDLKIPGVVITDVPTGVRVVLNNDIAPNTPSDLGCGPYVSGETQDLMVTFRRKFPTSVSGTVNPAFGQFAIMPNPTSGKFHLVFSTDKDMKELNVLVKNVTGQVVFTKTYNHGAGQFDQEIDMSNQARGVYFVEVNTPTGETATKKLVVE